MQTKETPDRRPEKPQTDDVQSLFVARADAHLRPV
jgi:hypothetical protein